MKVREVLCFGEHFLGCFSSDEAELLLRFAMGVARPKLLASLTEELDTPTFEKFEALLERRKKGEPLAYITGATEFYGLEFEVDRNVLIPRMDSEVLVEVCADYISRNYASSGLKIVDLCTGSGVLIIAIIHSLFGRFPDIYGVGIDVSVDALRVAKKNKAKLLPESRLYFREEDVFSENFALEGDVVISNPPYIRARDFESLEVQVRDFEPRLALDGGDDGLKFYRRIAEICRKKRDIFLEIGFGQACDVRNIFEQAGYILSGEFADSAGVIRVLHFKT